MPKKVTTEALKKQLKAQQKKQADQMKIQEEKQEQIVITAREKIMPILKDENRTIPETKRIIETLAVTINQGVYLLMKENNVSKLDLPSKIAEDYLDKDIFLKVLDEVKDEPLDKIVAVLQWLTAKIDNDLKKEVKDKKFNDIVKDF